MGWELSTWLALGRSFQLLGSLAAVCMHGYLTIKVFAGKLGLSEEMVVLEVLVRLATLSIFADFPRVSPGRLSHQFVDPCGRQP